MAKIIVLCGPPKSGKDTFAGWIDSYKRKQEPHASIVHVRLGLPLREITHALFGVPGSVMQFEHTKDAPSAYFNGMTPREAYIWVDNAIVRPTFGNSHYAKITLRRLTNVHEDTLMVINGPRDHEDTQPFIDEYGKDNVLVLNLHQEGTTWEGDSRSYLPLNLVPMMVDFHVAPGKFDFTRESLIDLYRFWSAGKFQEGFSPTEWP